jgi:hypothetical protein
VGAVHHIIRDRGHARCLRPDVLCGWLPRCKGKGRFDVVLSDPLAACLLEVVVGDLEAGRVSEEAPLIST